MNEGTTALLEVSDDVLRAVEVCEHFEKQEVPTEEVPLRAQHAGLLSNKATETEEKGEGTRLYLLDACPS